LLIPQLAADNANGSSRNAVSPRSANRAEQLKDHIADRRHDHTYQHGQRVELWSTKVTSVQTLAPMDSDHLTPFNCQPADWKAMQGHGQPPRINAIGQALSKNHRIHATPYTLLLGKDMYCEQVCVAHLGPDEARGAEPSRVSQAIRRNYQLNWILDDTLPAAFVKEDDLHIVTKYFGGIPMGYVSSKDQKAYLYNHMNMIVHYKNSGPNKYRIMRFQVQPLSIHHQFHAIPANASESNADRHFLPQIVEIANPIHSCQMEESLIQNGRIHTAYDSLTKLGVGPQPANGNVLFTYDVNWVENRDLEWSDRWEIYMTPSLAVRPRLMYLVNAMISAVVIVSLALAMIQFVRGKKAESADGRNNHAYTQLGTITNTTTTTGARENVNSSSDNVGTTTDDSSTFGQQRRSRPNTPSDDDASLSFRNGDDDYSDHDDCSSDAEDGWREDLEHYVFSPPTRQPLLLASCVAVGFHLAMTALSLLVATPVVRHSVKQAGGGGNGGIISSLVVVFVVAYTATAPLAGYVAGRVGSLFGNRDTSNAENDGGRTSSQETNDERTCNGDEEESDNGPNAIIPPNSGTTGGMMNRIVENLKHVNMDTVCWVLMFPAMFPLLSLLLLLLGNGLLISMPEEDPGVYILVPWLSIVILGLTYAFIFLPLLGVGYAFGISTRRRMALDDLMQESQHALPDDTDLEDVVDPESRQPWYTTPFFQACSGCLSFLICYQEFSYLLDAIFRNYRYDGVVVLTLVTMTSIAVSGTSSM